MEIDVDFKDISAIVKFTSILDTYKASQVLHGKHLIEYQTIIQAI